MTARPPKNKTTLGLIVGNRGFFPDHLCETGRKTMIDTLKKQGFNVVALGPEDTKFGSVETRADAKKCAELFRRRAGEIDGVVVTLPNFGDERSVADTLRLAGLDVPVLVHAFPDDPRKMGPENRRDSFCGKISVCNNLTQYGIKYSITEFHTVDPEAHSFQQDLADFGACCRVVRGLRNARIGAVGARPAAFNTVRYSEKLLEAAGISVVPIDLYDLFGRIDRLSEDAPAVRKKLDVLENYLPAESVPERALVRMARFGTALDEWVEEQELDATAVQCWTAIEEYFGIVPCMVMSLLSESLLPSACEVDITGALAMFALQLAAQRPSAILDWNNNYGDDPDLCVVFHCSNLPKSVFAKAHMTYQAIISNAVGKENAYGACMGRIRTGPFTFLRISTDDRNGRIRGYTGEGKMVDNPLDTFGGYGVARIAELQELLRFICANGLEHHVAMNPSQVSAGVYDALANYLGWDIYYHDYE